MPRPAMVMPAAWATRALIATGATTVATTAVAIRATRRRRQAALETSALRSRLDESLARIRTLENELALKDVQTRDLREALELVKTEAKLASWQAAQVEEALEMEQNARVREAKAKMKAEKAEQAAEKARAAAEEAGIGRGARAVPRPVGLALPSA